ncbi:MAG: putative glycolipid-binding domain-containing protein [Candidatus Eremiobacteraeota bacterium]|nr:putative glycolipid-binding domain-containing protein [Candidatus Eremiobacteraeota bacterium]
MDNKSFEQAVLCSVAGGYRLCGTVLASQDGLPLRVDYEIGCDDQWRTKACVVEQQYGAARKTSVVRVEADRWLVNGAHRVALDGCTDVDLGVSPSTNTLAINRLMLGRGEKQQIRAAWVKFPELEVEAAEQLYECCQDGRYIYRSLSSGFKAAITTDECGLPIVYEGVWERVAATVVENYQSPSAL